MSDVMVVGGISVEVVRKRVKNINITVKPPDGRVRVSVPWRVSRDTLRRFLLSRMDWIERARGRQQRKARSTLAGDVDSGSVWLWGTPVPLNLVRRTGEAHVAIESGEVTVVVEPDADSSVIGAAIEGWLETILREAALPLIEKWEALLQVKVRTLKVRRMQTRWGSCTTRSGSVRLNTELARHAPELLDYIVLHELVHLLEPNHAEGFKRRMDHWMPDWRERRRRLR